jgi:hypothetical protein
MPHLTAVASHIWLWSNQSVVETLMIALGMRVAHILVGCIRQRAFTQHQHLLQGLFFDGAHKPFTIGVEIWTARRQDDGLHPADLEQAITCLCELCIPIMDQIRMALP